MKESFTVSRKIRVPLDQYNSVEYFHSHTIEYSHEEQEEMTIIPEQEYKSLSEELDKIQRKIIEEETGVAELPMDICKENIIEKLKRKSKFKRKLRR